MFGQVAPPPDLYRPVRAEPEQTDADVAGGSYLDRLTGAPAPPPPPPGGPAYPPTQAPPPSGPSEFTRVVSAFSAPQAAAPPPPTRPEAMQAPAGRRSDTALIAGLVGVLLAAVIFVLLVLLL
jgi:hypothetical protein